MPKRTKKTRSRKTKSGNGSWMKQFTEFKDKISATDWMNLANQKRNRLTKEVLHLGDEIMDRIRQSDILANRDQLVKEARHHLESIVKKINTSRLIDRAMATAKETSSEILSFFNIPTQRELTSLQKRLHTLEKKVGTPRQGSHR